MDPVNDAHRPARRRLIEPLVSALGRYALETGFMSSWRALSWHELTHGRAASCSWVTGGAAWHTARGMMGME